MTADQDVEYGAHLPLIPLGTPPSLPALRGYVRAAARLGYRYLCANDHLVFGRPWLDGPTALAAVIEASGDMTIATTTSLPVLRGPVQLAKTLAALDILSGGRLVAGVSPGSSAGDYAAAGIGFDERWRRFDEALKVLRVLLHDDQAGFEGEFYSTRGVVLEPRTIVVSLAVGLLVTAAAALAPALRATRVPPVAAMSALAPEPTRAARVVRALLVFQSTACVRAACSE